MLSKKVQQKHLRVNFSFIEYINTLNCCISLDMRGAGRLVAVFLALVMVSSGLSVAFAQTSGSMAPVSVATEFPLYESGGTVNFSGMIKTLDTNNLVDVTIRVLGPLVNGTSSNIVQIKQVKPLLDGTFADNFIVGGPLWNKPGDYKIIANYGPNKAETTFHYNGGNGEVVAPPPPTCGEGQIIVNGNCVTPPEETHNCGTGTVYDPETKTCVVAQPVECAPGEELVDGKCVEAAPPVECAPGEKLVDGKCVEETPTGPVCGAGTHAEGNICVPDKTTTGGKGPGQCAIATAAFGSELAPQVQMLREVRDNILFSTGSGTAFMIGFNDFYYTFSPTVADWERESPVFKEVVKTTITPMLSTLSILNYVHIDSEQEMLGYGIGIMMLNVGMYFVAPAIVIVKIRGLLQKRRL